MKKHSVATTVASAEDVFNNAGRCSIIEPAAVPRRRLRPQRRREQLLDVAVELAAGADLAGVSVHDIAAAAGVSEGLLYHYFPTKEALLQAALQRAADAMTAAVDVVGRGEPLQALTAGLSAYLDHVEADPTGWRALLQARTGALADVAAGVEKRSRQLTLSLLEVDAPSPAVTAVIDGWAALERQICLTWVSHPTLTRTTVESLLLTSFLSLLTTAARDDEQAHAVLAKLTPEVPMPAD